MEKGFFGARRNLENRLEDYGYGIEIQEGYSMASGTQESLNQALEDLATAQAQLSQLQYQEGQLRASHATWKQAYDACNVSSCNWWNSASTCGKCRQPKLEKMAELEASITAKVGQINTKKPEISALQKTVNNLNSALEQEALAETTLAQQGLSSEAVAIMAQSKASQDEQSAKTKKIIIVSVAVAVVILGSIYAYTMIKRKRIAKKKK
jgi:hypothetical protein